MDMVRCMLKAKQMPIEFWTKVDLIAIYILNRYPTKSSTLRSFNKAKAIIQSEETKPLTIMLLGNSNTYSLLCERKMSTMRKRRKNN
ncbi:hypothetical protein CR513_29415, partial [Mucuna pruriens]